MNRWLWLAVGAAVGLQLGLAVFWFGSTGVERDPVPVVAVAPATVPAPAGWQSCVDTDPVPTECVELAAYIDPYGTSAPGGASTVPADLEGTAATTLGNAVDGLAMVPLAFAMTLISLLVVMMGLRMLRRVFS